MAPHHKDDGLAHALAFSFAAENPATFSSAAEYPALRSDTAEQPVTLMCVAE
jgi:hypothetical protein